MKRQIRANGAIISTQKSSYKYIDKYIDKYW